MNQSWREAIEIAATLVEMRANFNGPDSIPHKRGRKLARDIRAFASWRPTHRHYKGGLYRVVSTAPHTEREELLVIYENSVGEWWARPEAMFNGTVDGKRRFEPIVDL